MENTAPKTLQDTKKGLHDSTCRVKKMQNTELQEMNLGNQLGDMPSNKQHLGDHRLNRTKKIT